MGYFGTTYLFGVGFVAFYVSSVVVFAFVLLCKVSFPIVHILRCSNLYVFGIILIRYIAYALRYFFRLTLAANHYFML